MVMNIRKSLKYITMLVLLLIANAALYAQSNAQYDKALADSLGADNYGMKLYVFVLLKTGPASLSKATVDSLFAGHMKNINRLAENGKLIVAGPMQKNDKNYRGIFILNAQTIDEAAVLMKTDPAIQGGLLEPEFYGWYGSAALPMYLPYSTKIEKEKF
jgi:uncharacterized protein YciI